LPAARNRRAISGNALRRGLPNCPSASRADVQPDQRRRRKQYERMYPNFISQEIISELCRDGSHAVASSGVGAQSAPFEMVSNPYFSEEECTHETQEPLAHRQLCADRQHVVGLLRRRETGPTELVTRLDPVGR